MSVIPIHWTGFGIRVGYLPYVSNYYAKGIRPFNQTNL